MTTHPAPPARRPYDHCLGSPGCDLGSTLCDCVCRSCTLAKTWDQAYEAGWSDHAEVAERVRSR